MKTRTTKVWLMLLASVLAVLPAARAEQPKPVTHNAPSLTGPSPTGAGETEALKAEIASLKAQLASSQADYRALAMQSDLAQKVCEIPEFMAAKLAAAEARKKLPAPKSEAAKPTP